MPDSELCSSLCTPKCPALCFHIPKIPILVLPPRPLIPPLRNPSGNHPQGKILLLLCLITTATLVGAIFMVCLLVKKLREWRSSRRNGSALFDVQGQSSSVEVEEAPVFDYHVWYIHTVGLQQSVIDSITVFQYRKDEKLIDGSDCSICLGEFQDDDSLRLLPKCSHAFHIPCIDAWLRSHKNCPLCRAPVVSNSAAPNLTPIEPVTNPPPPIEVAQMETEAVDEENRGDETSEENSEIPTKELFGQAMRRSVSMDLVSAMADIQIREDGSSSNGVLVELKNSDSTSMNVPFPKREIGNQSLYNIVKSIGRSVPVAAISMERFSSGKRKLQWAGHYRSQSSVLPL